MDDEDQDDVDYDHYEDDFDGDDHSYYWDDVDDFYG